MLENFIKFLHFKEKYFKNYPYNNELETNILDIIHLSKVLKKRFLYKILNFIFYNYNKN